MHKNGENIEQIVKFTGLKSTTIYNWKALLKTATGEEKLLSEPNKSTYIQPEYIEKLKQHFIDNPFDFNKEIAELFNLSDSSIQRWRHKLGFKRKKAKTVYKEADEELKKTS